MESIGELINSLCCYVNLTEYKSEFETMKAVKNKPQSVIDIMSMQTQYWLKTHNQGLSRVDTAKSHGLRALGNKLFQEDKQKNALAACRLYTQAIFAAPPGETMSLAHANRAMTLQEFGYFQQAYDDCECALELGYPENLRHKIWTRQAFCAWRLGNVPLLKKHLDTLTYLRLNEKFSAEVENLAKGLKELQLNCMAPVVCNEQKTPFDDHRGSQKILKSDEKGRYMIANEAIAENSLIFNERASSFVTMGQMRLCHQCACMQLIPFPCYLCQGKVIYCSLKCKRAHFSTHKYECVGYNLNLFESFGPAHLAFRMVIDHKCELSTVVRRQQTAASIWKELMQLDGTAYAQLIQMTTHLDKMSMFVIRCFALESFVMVQYLSNFTDFFNDLSATRVSRKDLELVTESLILRHMGQILANRLNCSYIIRKRVSENPIEFDLMCDNLWASPGHVILGQLHQFDDIDEDTVANYPYLSLCNHSCITSVKLKFSGPNISIFAAKPIEAGEEILNSYTNDHRLVNHKERSNILKSTYHFECKCFQCTKDNPDEEFLKFHRYRCDQPKCRKVFSPSNSNWWKCKDEKFEEVNCTFCSSTQRGYERIYWFHTLMEEVKNPKHRQKIYKYFESLHDWLLDCNSLKVYLAKELVKECYAAHMAGSHLSRSEFLRLSKVIKFILGAITEQDPTNELFYVAQMTYLWDFIALGKYKPTKDEMQKMLQVIKVTSDEIYQIFINYYNDFIVDKLK